MKKFIMLLLVLGSILCSGVDIICCSFNRPLQLYALLESIENKVKGYENIFVICRADKEYMEAYKEVENRFPVVQFMYQSSRRNQAFRDFKPIVMDVLFNKERSSSKYCLFAMDDIIVYDYIDLDIGKNLLEQNKHYHGFFYRLGKNIYRQDFTAVGISGVPPLKNVEGDVCSWRFKEGKIDWNYPNNLDFTLYRKARIKKWCRELKYRNPNELEGAWLAFLPKNGVGLCHSKSKIVNIPMNRVNEIAANKSIGTYCCKDLHKIFNEGKKLDLTIVDPDVVVSVHQSFPFRFIDR